MDEYKVVGKFLSTSKITGEMVRMVIVQDERGACVMPEDEWKWVYGRQHRDRWNKNDSAAQGPKKGLFRMELKSARNFIYGIGQPCRNYIPLTKERAAKVENIFEHPTPKGKCYSVYLKSTDECFWCDTLTEIYKIIDEH